MSLTVLLAKLNGLQMLHMFMADILNEHKVINRLACLEDSGGYQQSTCIKCL